MFLLLFIYLFDHYIWYQSINLAFATIEMADRTRAQKAKHMDEMVKYFKENSDKTLASLKELARLVTAMNLKYD